MNRRALPLDNLAIYQGIFQIRNVAFPEIEKLYLIADGTSFSAWYFDPGDTTSPDNGTDILVGRMASRYKKYILASLGATNGLQLLGDDIGLGGSLTENTEIDVTSSHSFAIKNGSNFLTYYNTSTNSVGFGTNNQGAFNSSAKWVFYNPLNSVMVLADGGNNQSASYYQLYSDGSLVYQGSVVLQQNDFAFFIGTSGSQTKVAGFIISTGYFFLYQVPEIGSEDDEILVRSTSGQVKVISQASLRSESSDQFTISSDSSHTITAGKLIQHILLKSSTNVSGIIIGTTSGGTEVAGLFNMVAGITKVISYERYADTSFQLYFGNIIAATINIKIHQITI